ncbi:hypothetical protein [Stenotrophomonas phage CM2]
MVKKLKKHVEEDGFFYLDVGNVRTTLDMADGARHKLVFAEDLYRLKLADFLTLEGFVTQVELSTTTRQPHVLPWWGIPGGVGASQPEFLTRKEAPRPAIWPLRKECVLWACFGMNRYASRKHR